MKLTVQLREYGIAGKIWSVETDPPTYIRHYNLNRLEISDTDGGREKLAELVQEKLEALFEHASLAQR